MKIYTLHREQFLPLSIDEAWDFFSSPKNLSKITPPHMKFRIIYISRDNAMYAGQVIRYIVHVLPGIPVHWMTEITHVKDKIFFVDEQRFGPYALWHHQHHFKEAEGGIHMTDIINYALPLGFLGRLAHWLFVKEQLSTIFDYRFSVLEHLFTKDEKIADPHP